MSAAAADQVQLGTDWMPHCEYSVANEHELTTCDGVLFAARRSGKWIEVECRHPDCLFAVATDDASFRKALLTPEQAEDLKWFQK